MHHRFATAQALQSHSSITCGHSQATIGRSVFWFPTTSAPAKTNVMSQISYQCTACQEIHTGFPDLGFPEPVPYTQLAAADQADAVLTADECHIGDDRYVRCLIELPILGTEETFCWGVWGSLSPASFAQYRALLHEPQAISEGPWFSWLCSALPGYPDTLNLKCHLHPGSDQERPRLELEPTDHPLAVQQRDGVSVEFLIDVVSPFLHPASE